MQLTAYEIALIAGGFGIVGALLGALLSYRCAIKLANINAANAARQAETNALRDARAMFRAAFAPALAEIYLARHHGTHDTPIVGDILKKSLLTHASAIEEFRPFVSNGTAYQEAWENYRKTVRQDNHDIDTAEWGTDAATWSTVEAKIQSILAFSETQPCVPGDRSTASLLPAA